MSRIPIRTFLIQAKRALQTALKEQTTTSFVIGNESADLDSIASALVYSYLQSSKPETRRQQNLTIPITNIPAGDLRLRPELTALLAHAGLEPSQLITLDDLNGVSDRLPPEKTNWTLVDHNAFQGPLGKTYSERVIAVIDHHPDEEVVSATAEPRRIEKSGSCASHVVDLCRSAWDSISALSSSVGAARGQDDGAVDDAAFTSTWDAQVAKLALGAILIDTINLEAEEKVTEFDWKAVKYLEARIHISPKGGQKYERKAFFNEVNEAKSNLDDLSLEEILRKDYKEWNEGELSLGICSCVQSVEYLKDKSDRLVDELVEFAQKRGNGLFAIMTAHNSSGSFARELLLLAVKDGGVAASAEAFVSQSKDELELEESAVKLDGGKTKVPFLQLWEQKNLVASRKQVAPLLRDAMKSHQASL